MTELSAQVFFTGAEDIDPDDLGHVEVTNFSTAADRVLTERFQWDGTAIGCVGLTLSPDNSRVNNGVFVTRGITGLSEYSSPCDQIWPEAPSNIALAIRIASLDSFTFSSGGLWSDLIPAERFIVAYFDTSPSTGRTPILGTPTAPGIGAFCIRFVCQVSSSSSGKKGVVCKYTLLLYPESAEELGNTPEAQQASWPGLKIGDGYLPLGPRPTSRWRCPILPFVKPGTPFVQNSVAPASFRLRFAISSVMGKVVQPDIARSIKSLTDRWEKIRTNPRELANKPPATCWPVATPFQETAGRKGKKFKLVSITIVYNRHGHGFRISPGRTDSIVT